MKFVKTLFLSINLLLFCSIGVMAASEGTATPQLVNYISKDGSVQQTTATPLTESSTNLTFGTTNNWYFAGQTTQEASSSENVSINFAENPGTGDINIIVGSNGAVGKVAMTITNSTGLELSENQNINIYAAANDSTTADDTIESNISNCFLTLYNNNQTTEPGEEDVQVKTLADPAVSALTLNGGNLNVYSGVAFAPTALEAPGLTVTSGKVTVAAGGQLQPTENLETANSSSDENEPEADASIAQASATANGLNIGTQGTLTNSGYLKVVQNITDSTWDYAGIGGTGTLTNNGGTVQTTTSYNTSSTNLTGGTGGVWITSSGNSIGEESQTITASNISITAFGTATLFTGGYNAITLTGTNSMTVNGNNSQLTIPDDYTLNFGSAGGTSPNGKLTVNAGGTLIIDSTANVTMNAGSVLENSGTITVQPPSTTTPSN